MQFEAVEKCPAASQQRNGFKPPTIEDPTPFPKHLRCRDLEKNRRTILGASMLGCRGKVQREGDVIHLIIEGLRDLSGDLKRVSGLDTPFPIQPGRGDNAKHGGGPDSREVRAAMIRPRDIYEPDRHVDTLKVSARNFR